MSNKVTHDGLETGGDGLTDQGQAENVTCKIPCQCKALLFGNRSSWNVFLLGGNGQVVCPAGRLVEKQEECLQTDDKPTYQARNR